MNQEPGLKITRRHLPHWTLEGSIYYITFSLIKGKLSSKECGITYDLILEGDSKYYYLISLVVMPTHVHMVIDPLPGKGLSSIMKRIKGVTARKINVGRGRIGSIWKPESFDTIIRNEKMLEKILAYIEDNPVKSLLVENSGQYEFYWSQADLSE